MRPDCGISKYDALNILLASIYVQDLRTYLDKRPKFDTLIECRPEGRDVLIFCHHF